MGMGEQLAKRIPLSLGIRYRKNYSRRIDKGVLKNISLSGAFIEDPEAQLKEDEKINLTFELGGRTRNIAAKIVWTSTDGAGINFLHTNNQDEQLIDDLMYFVEEKKDNRKEILDLIFKKVG